MDEAVATGGLVEARDAVEQVCRLLVTPSPAVLDRAAAVLERAVGLMADWLKKEGRPGEGQSTELRHLRRAAAQARALLEKAAAFHAGWTARLGSWTGGYQAGGEPAAVIRPGRIWVEG